MKAQESFRHDPTVQILLATDAAGEGINLQRAHLMVNYDLPWNPNRLEQRFGRIHRIGQTEVCHLWNLVAEETREGDVYRRLLEKLEQARQSLGGQVFDVLGKLQFEGKPLRDLMIQAIRYGDQPEVQARLTTVLDHALDRSQLQDLLEEHALAHDAMDASLVNRIREDMERAEARRLQPHYIESFFLEAFRCLGGSARQREPRRYMITHVPALVRNRDRLIGIGEPVLPRYERIAFEKSLVTQPGQPLAAGMGRGGRWCVLLDGKRLEAFDGVAVGGVLFSPDSQELSYSAFRNEKRLVVRGQQEGREYENIGARSVQYSPDGRSLVYIGKRGGRAYLVVNELEVASHEAMGGVVFSSDGSRIAYVGVDRDRWRIIVDGEEVGQIAPGAEGSLAFVNDDSDVRFCERGRQQGSLVVLPGDLVEPLFRDEMADLTGAEPSSIGHDHTFVTLPEFDSTSPSGKRKALVIPNRGRLAVYLDETLGMFHDALLSCPPVFSTSGEHIAYAAENEGDWSLYLDGMPIGAWYSGIVPHSQPRFLSEEVVSLQAWREYRVYSVIAQITEPS